MFLTVQFNYSTIDPIIYENTSTNPYIPGPVEQLTSIQISESRYNLSYSISIIKTSSDFVEVSKQAPVSSSGSAGSQPVLSGSWSNILKQSLSPLLFLLFAGIVILVIAIVVVVKKRKEKKFPQTANA
jgi:hypothetical protein